MCTRTRTRLRWRDIASALALLGAALLPVAPAAAQDKKNDKLAEPISKGQRVFTCGHSFHVWVPGIVADLCKKAQIPDHVQVGVSSIGGSRVIQHWDIAEDKNKAKEALKTGKVDVLTLSPIFLPDEGIENFTKLAREHNPDVRIAVQPIWLRWDVYEPTMKRPDKVDHNAITGEELRKRHEPYFQSIDEHVRELNKKEGQAVLFVVPAPQAVIALREKIIAGEAPGLKTQEDLFTDALGHGKPPLQALVGYCNYAVIYRRSPVGLPVPEVLKQAKLGDQEEKLNRLLQELAWEAVVRHPLSGARPERPVDELEPWASDRHPKDVARRHAEEITAARQEYRVTHGGTMDGANCRSPVGGSFGVWDQSWESNRAVRMENVGETDVINPWLSNGRNDFRTLNEMVAGALRPGMTEREKALALWRLQTTHRFHATTGDAEVNDPVKAINVYGYTTCGDDSICLAGLWKAAGFQVRPARVVGHCITQVRYDGRWNLLDGDMGPFYLLRDNVTVAGEQDLVRDHDLLKRTHTHGILDADSRAAAEWSAALFVYEGEAGGDRNSVRDTTMNLVLRPNEALVWRWGHLTPLKYHGKTDITVWGKRAAERICNGLWEYRPDFTRDSWRQGADTVENVRAKDGALVAEAGKTGVLVWKMRSPYVFVGGRLEVEGAEAKFSLSWDGTAWQEVGQSMDALFPAEGPARYEYRLRCELPEGARLQRLAVVNDLQMAPLALPGMVVGENRFTYTDQSTGPRRVRLTHEWVERSLSRAPGAPPAPVFPTEGARTDGTDIVFEWRPPQEAGGDGIADYHFELSDRADMAWPLSSNFSKLVSNTAERGKPRYGAPYTGLLTPGREYFWRVRARNDKGVWGPWSQTWSFTAGGPAPPVDVTLEPAKGDDGKLVLRWKPNTVGQKPVKYRVYGSDEKGFSVSDEPYRMNVGQSRDLPAQSPANFVAETSDTELLVLGAGIDLPNANKAFYRVVAIDDKGKRSGPSDYAAAARPFVYSKPANAAKVGTEFRYQVSAVRSLGDLRLRIVEGKEVASFWDIEKPRFVLVRGPAWLRMDESTGLLSGVPDAVGNPEVVVTVTLERSVRRLDEARLSWGQELVKEVITEKVGSATQRFRITVER